MAPLFGRFPVIKSWTINLSRFGPARPSGFHPGAVCCANLTVAFVLWHTTLLFAVLQHTPESGQAGHRRGLDTRVRDACQAPKGGHRGQSGGAECWPPAVEPAKTAARWVGRWVGGGGGGVPTWKACANSFLRGPAFLVGCPSTSDTVRSQHPSSWGFLWATALGRAALPPPPPRTMPIQIWHVRQGTTGPLPREVRGQCLALKLCNFTSDRKEVRA